MKINKAHAFWKGNLKEGNGRMQFENSDTEFPFSFKSRFEDGVGANPEMLIGSAHAGCFSMAFSMTGLLLPRVNTHTPCPFFDSSMAQFHPIPGSDPLPGSHA